MSAGNGPSMAIPLLAAGRDRRPEHVLLFVSDEAVLPRVRVEPGEGEPRGGDAEARQLARGQHDRALERLAGQRPGHFRERDVHGREHDAQRVGVEHHGDARRSREVGEQIRVPAPRQPGRGEGFLVDRRGGDGVDHVRLRVGDRAGDGVVGGTAGLRRHAPARERVERRAGRRAVEHDVADRPGRRVRGRLVGDFRPDARGVPDGHADLRPHRHLCDPHPPDPHVPHPPPGPVGLLHDPQPPSSAHPPCFTPLPFGSS